MRKFAVYGASALLVISSAVGVVGISYAQDTATPAPSATEIAAPAQAVPVARVWLGISVSDDGTGVTVKQVSPGSPAETAKLQADDVILSVNGTAVDTAAELRAIIDAAASGDVVALSVQRGTETLSVDVTLATISGRMGGFGRGQGGAPTLPTDSLQAAEWVLHTQLEVVDNGYQVTAVNDNDGDAVLAVGDVITQVNGTAIASVDWATLIVPPTDPTAPAPTLALTVLRDGTETTVDAQVMHFGGRGGRGGQPGNGGPGGRGDNNGQPGGNGGPNNNGGQPPFPRNGDNQPGNGNALPPLPSDGSNALPPLPSDGTQASGGSA